MPIFFLAMLPGILQAHTVPSLTLEATFQTNGRYLLKANVDPRLFLAADPTSLPPVEAGWYRGQSAEQLNETEAKAADYLRQALVVTFGGAAHELSKPTFQPMDGATNERLSPTSQEVHLLAEVTGPTAPGPFQVRLGQRANTSLILLTTIGDQAERRPMVLFPGETSIGIEVPQPPVEMAKMDTPVPSPHWGWWLAAALVALLTGWRLRRQ
jgi:MYXO-CTERM domain-containing protein